MMPFDMMIINDTVILGDTEIWQLTNQTRISHPFHIHDVSFQILDINGAPPAPEFAGRKDVVMVPPMGGVVRFIAKFEDYADPVFPYMYHCHMLTHEDGGMMGQFLVIDTTTGIHENALAENMYSIFPNPVMAGDFITINASVEIDKIDMFDVSGRLLVAETLRINHTNRYRMSTHGMAAGIYQVKLYSGSNTETKLFVVLE
jgi:bilirubin oxidase